MSVLKIEITAGATDFSTFADELGYPLEVFKTPAELALIPEPWTTQDRLKPNPQTKQQFLEAYFKEVVVGELLRQKSKVIELAVRTDKEAEKATLKGVLANAVSVTSQV